MAVWSARLKLGAVEVSTVGGQPADRRLLCDERAGVGARLDHYPPGCGFRASHDPAGPLLENSDAAALGRHVVAVRGQRCADIDEHHDGCGEA